MTMPGSLMRRSSEPRCDAASSAASRAKHSFVVQISREILNWTTAGNSTTSSPRGRSAIPNGSANEKSVSWLCSRAVVIGGNLLELYCGAGTHTCALSKSTLSASIAVEVDAKLVERRKAQPGGESGVRTRRSW